MVAIAFDGRCSACGKKPRNPYLYAIIERQCIVFCPDCRKKFKKALSDFLSSHG